MPYLTLKLTPMGSTMPVQIAVSCLEHRFTDENLSLLTPQPLPERSDTKCGQGDKAYPSLHRGGVLLGLLESML